MLEHVDSTNGFENFRETQNLEFKQLKSIFGENLEDMRPETGRWTPLDFKIRLRPQTVKPFLEASYVTIHLYITCEQHYPENIPVFRLTGENLPDSIIEQMTREIRMAATRLKGQSMVLQIARTIQATLDKNLSTNDLNNNISDNGDTSECNQHSTAEIINLTGGNRRVCKGRCIKHYENGCISFSAIDMDTGEHLYITERMIEYSQLEAKCSEYCQGKYNGKTCIEHSVDTVAENIQNQLAILTQLSHKHLVHYKFGQCEMKPKGIVVYLVQEFVIGCSVGDISKSIGWSDQSAGVLAREVLGALIYLGSNGIAHGLLNNTNVYLDNHSIIRVADFALVSYIQELTEAQTTESNDLKNLGLLIESLMPIRFQTMLDFIEKCKADEAVVLADLLDDPFLRPLQAPSISRFENDFIKLDYLGRGGFGNVYKGTNIMDNRTYAIKRIPLPKRIRQRNLLTREVKLLSRLNHPNIVRYYGSWIGHDSLSTEVDSESGSMFSDCLNDSTKQDYEESLLLYIQMEYCDGQTLSYAIENQLYKDTDQIWFHFIQLVEGLSHIHKKGMIHRDLKPANIFISSENNVKIGDFGLATICYYDKNRNCLELKESLEIEPSSSLDEEIGTKLYSAPELNDNRSQCDEKVDIYSLGIILFEMSCPPFRTGTERLKVIEAVRTPLISIPEDIEKNINYTNQSIIKWLLCHNSFDRPSAEDILSSDLLPASKSESLELNNIMNNPHSKQYKNLVKRCLQQECNTLVDLTYNYIPFHKSISSTVEYVKSKILKLFQKHGGNEITLPLLSPCSSSNSVTDQSSVRLMTNSGINVYLPPEARYQFARFVTMNRITSMRRYAIEPIYAQNLDPNIHPKRSSECAFDVITQKPGNLFVCAELLSMGYAITREIPMLQQKNISIRINHSNLLKALLLYFKVPANKYADLLTNLLNFSEMKITKSRFKQVIGEIIPRDRERFYKFSQTKYTLKDPAVFLRGLLNGEGEVARLATAALSDLKEMLKIIQQFGVNCKISLVIGLQIGYQFVESGGIVWQMIAEDDNSVSSKQRILAAGQCYDTFLSDYRKYVQNHGWQIQDFDVGGVGFSFFLDTLTTEVTSIRKLNWESIDVVCVHNSENTKPRATAILNSLWDADIRSGPIEAQNFEEARVIAQTLGARLIVTPDENNMVKLAIWHHNIMYEKKMQQQELVDSIKKMLQSSQSNERSITLQNTNESRINCILKNENSPTKSRNCKKKKNGKALRNLILMERDGLTTLI